jgi:hypothetical protein
MSGNETKPTDGLEFAFEWIAIEDGLRQADPAPLVAYLRSQKKIDRNIIELIADLFDSLKPRGFYARIISVPGPKSKLIIRDIPMLHEIDNWKTVNKKNRVPIDVWQAIGSRHNMTADTAKQAVAKAKRAVKIAENE